MPRAYEEIQTDLLEIRHAGEAVQWTVAALCAEALAWTTPRQLAADVGLSASQVRRYVHTLAAFPVPETRCDQPGITFSHHVLAAETPDPAGWLDAAAHAAWSTRQLREAIGATKRTPAADAAAHLARLEGAWLGFCNAWEVSDAETREDVMRTVRAWVRDQRGPA